MTKTWSISEIARLTGTTSRTLRHYDAVGLLPPTKVGDNGYRFYDAHALIRLQRILLLRELGMGLGDIATVLTNQRDESDALSELLTHLRLEADRLDRQIRSVEQTIDSIKNGNELMAEDMFDGWDNSQFKEEVTSRWGEHAWNASAKWWDAQSAEEMKAFKKMAAQEIQEWIRLAESGVKPGSPEAQVHAQRAVDRVNAIPGTPGHDGGDIPTWIRNLAAIYVIDPRFTETYGGIQNAQFVHDALVHWADAQE